MSPAVTSRASRDQPAANNHGASRRTNQSEQVVFYTSHVACRWCTTPLCQSKCLDFDFCERYCVIDVIRLHIKCIPILMDETDRHSSKLTVTSPCFACNYTYAVYHDQSRQVLTRHGPHGLVLTRKQPLRVPWRGARSSTNRGLAHSRSLSCSQPLRHRPPGPRSSTTSHLPGPIKPNDSRDRHQSACG